MKMVGTTLRYFFCDEKLPSLSDTMKIGAFADCKKKQFEPELIIPNEPFSKLFTEKISPDKHSQSAESLANGLNDSKSEKDKKEETKDREKNGNERTATPTPLETRLGSLTMVSTNDDFIMKTPFASMNEKSELGLFYQEWQKAPPLQAFIDLPPLEELDLTKQLETFETEGNEYDTIVQSLCQSPNNN